jgi:hypothetical protein
MPPFGSKHSTASRRGEKTSRATVTRSGSDKKTGNPQSPGMTSSDEDEEKVTRPAGDRVLHINKRGITGI